MSPFDPPVGSPHSVEPPHHLRGRGRRNRRASVALATVGLVGAGIVGVGQLVSADRSDARAAMGESAPPVTTAPTTSAPVEPDEAPATTVADDPVTDDADRPIDLDFGTLDAGALGSLAECLGLPSFQIGADGPLGSGEMHDDLGSFLDELFSGGQQGRFADGELDAWLDEWLSGAVGESGSSADGDATRDLGTLLNDVFAGRADEPFAGDDTAGWLDDLSAVLEEGATDGQVTVTGPDGVSVIDLGDDGSVTISRDGGDVSIETEGEATVIDLGDLLGDLGAWIGDDVELDDDAGADVPAELERWLDELLADVPTDADLPELGSIDSAGVQACIDDVLGR